MTRGFASFARWRREHAPAVLRRRMPAPRTLLWLVCLGISLLTFVLVLAGTALSTGSTGLGRILGTCFIYGIACGLPALFVLSRFAVVEIARTPQRGYRRRVLLCGVPLSVRTVPEGRLVRVQEAGTGGWHGVSGISPSAKSGRWPPMKSIFPFMPLGPMPPILPRPPRPELPLS